MKSLMSKGKGIRTTTVVMSQVYCKTWTSFDVNPAKREKEEDQDSQRYGGKNRVGNNATLNII